MTEDSVKTKLTLSGKTLTLKGLGEKASSHDGKKVVQVEVRKKRVIQANQPAATEQTKELDAATQAKLRLIAEGKEHDAKRKIEEEEKQQQRKKIEEELRAENARKEAEEAQKAAEEQKRQEEERQKAEAAQAAAQAAQEEFSSSVSNNQNEKNSKNKERHSKDFNDDEDEKESFSGKKYYSENFEQDRKKITKRSFEPQRRNNKVSIHSFSGSDEDDDDYGFGAPRRRFKKKQPKPVVVQQPQEKIIKEVIIPEVITVQELANRMAEKSAEVIKKLMSLGVMATINQAIDADTAQIIVEEMGHKWKRVADSDVEDILKNSSDSAPEKQLPRAPVVTVMGHVDHGKTSLLDALRETNVVAKEAGGITQHIGAYQIEVDGNKKITFIDTPGHEAFSEMRARGAKVTDIVVLVVAANDGIMPQTIEAIRHAQAAEVPIVVAINKIDLPGADPMKVKTELLQHGIAVEEMGGECLCAEVSAKKRINIEKLLEAILLQAEILDLRANPNCKATGTVIEAKMEKGRGSVATLLVQQGTLQIGDIIIAGKEWGHVRAMFNEHGHKIQSATPATPVEVLGLQGTPAAGDNFNVVESESQAKEITNYRIQKERDAKLVKSAKSAMEQMLDKIKSGEIKHLPIVIKADVQGSIEAIEGTLNKLSNDEVSVQILHSAVGPISESDVTLAKASHAFIIGFNVRAIPQARDMARRDGIDIRYYSIIYDVADDVKKGLEGMLSPELKEKIIGYAEIRNVFNITGVGKVAGCMVTEGLVKRGAKVRLLRDNVVIHDGNLGQLKRFKDDVKEVKDGYECGMSFENYNDIQVGDFIECYEIETIAAKL